MTVVFANNAAGELALALAGVDGSCNLVPGQGVRFPAPDPGNYAVVTLQYGSTFEIAHLTARSGDVLTLTRGQDGTIAENFPIGATVEMRVTKGLLEAFRQSGDAFADEIILEADSPFVTLKKTAGNAAGVQTYVGANLRWRMELGNATGEGGGNAGSDFVLLRYADNGTQLGAPLVFTRNTPEINLRGSVTVNNYADNGGNGNATLQLTKEASGKVAQIAGYTNGLARWGIELGNSAAESGTSTGSDFALNYYKNDGTYLATAFSIARANGKIYVGTDITSSGYYFQEAGNDTGFYSGGDGVAAWKINGVYKGNFNATGMVLTGGHINMHEASVTPATYRTVHCNGGAIGFLRSQVAAVSPNGWIAYGTDEGNWTVTGNVIALSDQRLKANVRAIDDALDLVMRLRGVRYERKDQDYRPGIGVIAQEVQSVVPEVVRQSGDFLGVNHDGLVGVLIEAVKTLAARVEQLEARS
jgi:hypothetical protein